MSKLINNEGATKATLSILSNLTEAENLKVKKTVLTEGHGKVTVKEAEELEECPIVGDGNVPEGAIDPVKEEVEENMEEESALDKSMNALDQIDALAGGDEKLAKMGREMGLEEFKKYLKDNGLMKEESEEVEDKVEDKVEERVCEGLEIVNIKGNTVLLKESKGYIVGKNYDKETGLIESAEEYKTEKVANKAFKRMSSK